MKQEKLIAKRKKCNLTQEQVAIAAQISIRNYQNIEAGTCKPNIETVISIANLFGVADIRTLFCTPQQQLRQQMPSPSGATEGKGR